jgi:ribulose-5-phosphate 4-epimerase/fuculose-1-phosphate aldolase
MNTIPAARTAGMDEAKVDVAIANRILAETGLAAGVRAFLGHASSRLPSDPTKFLVKGRGYRIDVLSRLRPEDLITCDLEGYLVDGPPGIIQCGEVQIHACIYKVRPEVQSIVHVHPKFTVIMSILQSRLRPMAQEGIKVVQAPLPVYPHTKVVMSQQEGEELARYLGDGDAVLMLGHGAVTVGRTLEESVTRMIHLEHQAEMNYLAYCATGPNHPGIPEPLVEEVLQGKLFDGPHFDDAIAKHGKPSQPGTWNYLQDLVSQRL